jgi:hypothetical protein
MDGETLFFLFYVGVLPLSGVLMLVLAGIGFGAGGGARVLNGVIGLAALAYAIYLILTVFINGGSYQIFFYAFIIPVIAIVQMVKGFKARGAQSAEQNAILAQMGHQAPQGHQMPPQGQAPYGYQAPQGHMPPQGYQMPPQQAPQGYQPQQGYQMPPQGQMPQAPQG